MNLDLVRAITPLKTFLFRDVEEIKPGENKQKKNIIFGVKECDLQAKKILDHMFLAGVCKDPLIQIMQ